MSAYVYLYTFACAQRRDNLRDDACQSVRVCKSAHVRVCKSAHVRVRAGAFSCTRACGACAMLRERVLRVLRVLRARARARAARARVARARTRASKHALLCVRQRMLVCGLGCMCARDYE
eukprot:6203918-Pleurochrysis_carterae.AAC.1